MRSDSCHGDVGLPRSKKAVCSPVGDHPQSLYHMCSLTFTPDSDSDVRHEEQAQLASSVYSQREEKMR